MQHPNPIKSAPGIPCVWEQRLDRLEDYLLELQGKPKKHNATARSRKAGDKEH